MVESIDSGNQQAPAAQSLSAGQSHSQLSLSKCLVVVSWIGMIIFAFHASTHMVAAGDTWVAMACGRHFVNHGVDTVEPFSANSHKPGPTQEEIEKWPKWAQSLAGMVDLETLKKWHPTGWINQNWLTHVIFYKVTTSLGSEDDPYYDALVYGKYLLYVLTVICLYTIARIQGVFPLLAAGFAAFALFVGRSFLDIRPAGFSNLLVPLFILILVLTQYRHILFIWLIVPLSIFWCNVHGGYIYVFIMLIPFFVMNVLALPFQRWIDSIGSKGLYHTVGAGLTAFICVILFNPFHLTNLTHTFIISVSKNAARWREIYEWHPAFEWTNPVGTAVPFLILSILAFLVILTWPFVHAFAKSRLLKHSTKLKRKQKNQAGLYTWPKLNLPLLMIAALTLYMAVRSRRFIPIAAFVACPFMAVLLQQIMLALRTVWQSTPQQTPPTTPTTVDKSDEATLSWVTLLLIELPVFVAVGYFALRFFHSLTLEKIANRERALEAFYFIRVVFCIFFVIVVYLGFLVQGLLFCRRSDRKQESALCAWLTADPGRWGLAGLGAVIILCFGVWTWTTYHRIYLAPWPANANHHSVFMRMTASFLKPFEACEFIRLNKLEGKMMNYWTEGGCIAWGQTPDPNTGKTPLQLFMDGRAQAAYNRRTFDLWNALWNGGELGVQILRNPSQASPEDYKKTGQWISQALRGRNVWAALAPQGQFDKPFCRSLEHLPGEWPLIYQDGKQKLFVDIQSEQGKKLFFGIETGTTLYPNEFTRHLNLAYYHLIYDQDDGAKQTGLSEAIQAYEAESSQAAMLLILGQAARYRPLWDQINEFCTGLINDFDKNKETYRRQHGYQEKIASSRFACQHLARYAQLQGNTTERTDYLSKSDVYRDEIKDIMSVMRW